MQVVHRDWEEDPTNKFVANYQHINGSGANWVVQAGQVVKKGQLLGHTGASASGFEHLHFEIRVGSYLSKDACNPWKYLPDASNPNSLFRATVELTANYHNIPCEAVVNVSVAADQLTVNRIELHITNGDTTTQREYDFCEDNKDHTHSELDNPLFESNLYVSPKHFNSKSYERGEDAAYGFEFRQLPSTTSGANTVTAKVYDVYGNVITTPTKTYTCA